MIVSASYRTDIPAYYGRWFLARLAAGFCRTVNPYGGAPGWVDLSPGAIDGFVFWTRNAAPFRPALEAVATSGLPFIVHYTITGLPPVLERHGAGWEHAASQVSELANRWGPRVAVWRYDPIVITATTPPAWHLQTFSRLAQALTGWVDEVVVSFLHPYRKTRQALARAGDLGWRDPSIEERRELLLALRAVADDCRMRLSTCTQPDLDGWAGIAAAACVDTRRLSDVAGRPIRAKIKGNRPGCLCAESRDIGDYDSCPTGCLYCYAVNDPGKATRRRREHDPDGDFLFSPTGTKPEPPPGH